MSHSTQHPRSRSLGENSPSGMQQIRPSLLTILPERLTQLRALLFELAQSTVASVVLLADSNGRSVASWSRLAEYDCDTIAALAFGGLLARDAIGAQLGGPSARPFVTQEFEGSTLLLASISDDLALIVVIEEQSRNGLARVAIRRAGQRIAALFD